MRRRAKRVKQVALHSSLLASGAGQFIGKGTVIEYVYLLQSVSHAGKRHIGITSDLSRRLVGHNAGSSPRTRKFAPWRCVVAVHFRDDCKAEAFEK